MTGKQFELGIKRLGLTRSSMATALGCNRSTISARCKAEIVDEPFRYIMLGMLAERAAKDLLHALSISPEETERSK